MMQKEGPGATCHKNSAKQREKLGLLSVGEAEGGKISEDFLTLLVVHVFVQNKGARKVMHQNLHVDRMETRILQKWVSRVVVNAVHEMVKDVGQGERTDSLAHLP